MRPRAALALLLGGTLACQGGRLAPAELDTRHDACSSCRMAVSDRRFAAQLVAPAEVPLFFDDVGCLRDYLEAHPRLAPGSTAFVADHRTGEWLLAAQAVYARVATLETPMGSHLVAHSDVASRAADAAAAGGQPLGAGEVFGPRGPLPAGERR